MKTTKRNYFFNAKTRRGIFAWFTAIFSLSAIIFFTWYTLNFLGISIMIDSIINVSENCISGLTTQMAKDLTLCRELQNTYLLKSIFCIPFLLISFDLFLLWEHSNKNFLKSLIFKK